MHSNGYIWTITPQGEHWMWSIRGREDGRVACSGAAPSRAVAAAMIVRSLAQGVGEAPGPEGLPA